MKMICRFRNEQVTEREQHKDVEFPISEEDFKEAMNDIGCEVENNVVVNAYLVGFSYEFEDAPTFDTDWRYCEVHAPSYADLDYLVHSYDNLPRTYTWKEKEFEREKIRAICEVSDNPIKASDRYCYDDTVFADDITNSYDLGVYIMEELANKSLGDYEPYFDYDKLGDDALENGYIEYFDYVTMTKDGVLFYNKL